MTIVACAGRSDLGVTGHADPKLVPDGYLVLHKPFSRVDLAAKVTEATARKQD